MGKLMKNEVPLCAVAFQSSQNPKILVRNSTTSQHY